VQQYAGLQQEQASKAQPAVDPNAPMKYGSPAYNQKYLSDERVVLTSSAIKSHMPLPSPMQEKVMPTKYMRRKQVLAKIAQKQSRMDNFNKKLAAAAHESKRIEVKNQLDGIVPTEIKDQATGAVIHNSGHLSINRGIKPCFRPNGQLMTFHSKTQVQGPGQQVSVQTRGCLH
jgi:hypothetical protein